MLVRIWLLNSPLHAAIKCSKFEISLGILSRVIKVPWMFWPSPCRIFVTFKSNLHYNERKIEILPFGSQKLMM